MDPGLLQFHSLMNIHEQFSDRLQPLEESILTIIQCRTHQFEECYLEMQLYRVKHHDSDH